MKAGQICRVRCGRFTGLEVKVVERIPKNGTFRSIWSDRLRNWVNVSGTIELQTASNTMQEWNFQASLQVATLVKLDKKSASVYNANKGESIVKMMQNKVWGEIDKLLEM